MKYQMKLGANLLIFLASSVFAQPSMTLLNGKKVAATNEWKFVCEQYAFDGFATVQLAKVEAAAVIAVSVKTSTPTLFVGDRLFILLKNNDFVYCTDKNQRRYENGISTIFYNITAAELKKLLQQNITDIRFKIIGKGGAFDSQSGFFTASNRPTVYDAYSKELTAIDTKTEIKLLLK